MTRESEIEALAMQIHAQWTIEFNQRTGDWPEGENRDAMFEDHISTAMGVLAARDRYRAARQPAPETPTPSADLAALMAMMETYLDNPSAFASGPVIGMIERAYRLLKPQHAATLKERKEKADGA